jgi:hypothetical protein
MLECADIYSVEKRQVFYKDSAIPSGDDDEIYSKRAGEPPPPKLALAETKNF